MLNEKAEAATSSYSVTGDSLQFMYSVPVTKNHRNIRSRCSVHEFSFTDIFLTIIIMFTEQLYWRKNFCGCFRFIWLWLLISIKFIIRNLDSQHKIYIVLYCCTCENIFRLFGDSANKTKAFNLKVNCKELRLFFVQLCKYRVYLNTWDCLNKLILCTFM